MKIGTMVRFSSVEETRVSFEKLRAFGFDNCQLCSWEPEKWTDENAEGVKQLCEEYGITLSCFWCGWEGPKEWNFYGGQKTLGLVPEEYRAVRVKNLCDGSDFAAKLGVKEVATHMGYIPENPYDPNFEPLCDAIRTVAEHMKQNGQWLLFETGQETPVTLLRCFETVGTGNLAVNLDTANLILYGKANPVDALDVIGPYVRNIHAKDGVYPTGGSKLGEETRLGDGKVDFEAFFRKLHKLGYDAWVTIEREISGEQQDADIRYAADYLQKLIDEVYGQKKLLKVGLVGVGGISGAHIPAWDGMDDAALVAVCDIRPERMEKLSGKRCYTDFAEMLEKEELDILDICLPTYLHADYAVMAMEKGINVICEKPISLRREDVQRVYETAQRNGVYFMVAQVLRFWPEYEFLKEAYESGRYGKLLSGSMTRLGHYPQWSWDGWMMDEKRSGMVPFDLHIHDLDFMVYAFGKPCRHTCHRAQRPEQDYLNIVYEYDDFFITTEASWYAACYPFQAKFRFQFEKAIVAWEGELKVYDCEGNVLSVASKQGETGGIELPRSNAYANEIRYFADCVKAQTPPVKVQPEQLETVIDILKSF